MQELIDSPHYSELLAYETIRRPDTINIQLLLGQVAYMIAAVNQGKGSPPLKFKDFLKVAEQPKPVKRGSKRKKDDEMFNLMKVLTLALGGKVDIPDGDGSNPQRESNG